MTQHSSRAHGLDLRNRSYMESGFFPITLPPVIFKMHMLARLGKKELG